MSRSSIMDTQLVAKCTAIPLAFMLAGYGVNASQNSVPPLISQSARVSTSVFAQFYSRGIAPVVGGCVLSATSYLFLAFTNPRQRILYGCAAALVLGPLPITTLIVLPGVNRLLRIGESTQCEQEVAEQRGEVRHLLKAWIGQNWIRAGLYLGAGLTGLFTVLTEASIIV